MAGMVKRVTADDVQPAVVHHQQAFVVEEVAFGDSLLDWCSRLPWEDLVRFGSGSAGASVATRRASRAVREPPPRPQPKPMPPRAPAPTVQPAPSGGGPGCRAADACLLVHGYLVNLADGRSGFGVLQIAKGRLEEGAIGAAQMGQAQLAQEMRAVAQELPQVTTPEAAAALAPKLKGLSDQTWDLGRRCGGHNLSPAALEQARALAKRVNNGEVSMEKAVKELSKTLGESAEGP